MQMTKEGKRAMMYQNIERHGSILNEVFKTGIMPVELSKKLRRLEVKAHKIATDYCNGDNGVDSENIDTFTEPIIKAVKKILGHDAPVFFNGDARGYALKLEPEFVKDKDIYKDWGGNGIVAPDFRIA